MKVLSLFDGISCGMVALERVGIKVDRYVAYEIDDNAIKVSKSNYPQIQHCGDVINADFRQYKGFDLLIGGSPCQDLCGMGTRTGLNGSQSSLFYEFLRAKLTIKPKFFLLENNASMSQQNRDKITDFMGVEPILIDSGDFSAQIRKRLYWTNIPVANVPQKNILLKDIINIKENNRVDVSDKIYKYVFSGKYKGRKIEKCVRTSIRTLEEKSRTIGCSAYSITTNTGLTIFLGNGRYVQPTQEEFEMLQTLPKGYTSCLPIKDAVFVIGNGWTVDVIAHILKSLHGNRCQIRGREKKNDKSRYIQSHKRPDR